MKKSKIILRKIMIKFIHDCIDTMTNQQLGRVYKYINRYIMKKG